MRQHRNLSAMMGLMRNHIRKHGGAWRPWPCPTIAEKALDAPISARQGFSKHLRATPRAFSQRRPGLLLGQTPAVELDRQLQMRG